MRTSLLCSAVAVALLSAGTAYAQVAPPSGGASGAVAGSVSHAGSSSFAGSVGNGSSRSSSSAGNFSTGGANVSSGPDTTGFLQSYHGGVHNNVNTYSSTGGFTTSSVATTGHGIGGASGNQGGFGFGFGVSASPSFQQPPVVGVDN